LIPKLPHRSDTPGFRGEGYSLKALDGKIVEWLEPVMDEQYLVGPAGKGRTGSIDAAQAGNPRARLRTSGVTTGEPIVSRLSAFEWAYDGPFGR
jgi:hypothetical protein